MRILVDECLPRHLSDHECETVQEMGWSGKKNGELLTLAEPIFDVLLTIDKGMGFQQIIAGRRIAVLALAAHSNRLSDLLPVIPGIQRALQRIQPGTLYVARPE